VQYERRPAADAPAINVFEMMEMPEKGSVLVASVPSPYAIVGENIMHAAVKNGLAGMVLDGVCRDSGVIRREQLPLFCKGRAIRLETECKISTVQIPVQCGGVLVRPGDYIVGDCDGVIVRRPEEVEKLIYQAERIADIEAEMEAAIQGGQPMSSVAAISKKKKQMRS
jgi:regulator of RNase E activity RraA